MMGFGFVRTVRGGNPMRLVLDIVRMLRVLLSWALERGVRLLEAEGMSGSVHVGMVSAQTAYGCVPEFERGTARRSHFSFPGKIIPCHVRIMA